MAAPTTQYGTLSSFDLLKANFQTIAQIGEDKVFDAVSDALDAHNRIMADIRGAIMEDTNDRLKRYGSPAVFDMAEIDEFGTPDVQKIPGGSLVGFPLKQYGRSLGWTYIWMQRKTAAELAAQIQGIMDADRLNLIKQTKTALYSPLNYTFDDRYVDHLTTIPLPVKALANADGAPIPIGPNGEFFDGTTHTHYLVAATPGTPVNADFLALLSTVIEHYAGGQARLLINQAQESLVRGLGSDFTALIDAQLIPATTATIARGPLNTVLTNNRQIGVYRGAEVWVKPWVPAGYPTVVMGGQERPLAFRSDPLLFPDLSLVYENEHFPLRARGYMRAFGIGVWRRTAAAVLDITHATYTAPVIT